MIERGQHVLPEYTVRTSARARRVRLTVTAREGLTVVVPSGWRGDADAVVASKRAWATRALAQVAERRAAYLGGPETLLPEHIELPACARSLPVRYVVTDAPNARVHDRGTELVVSGSAEPAPRLAALRRWMVAEARRRLPERVAGIVRVHALEAPIAVRISSARTRWGSCSGRGTIALNRALLFLPPELADYVIAHELAHLRHMDHSPRFWSELAQIDPRSLEHRRAMKEAGRLVPAWVDA